MALDDAAHRIIAELLHAHTGQTLSENRRWRVSTALSGVFREYGISNVDQLVCLLGGPDQKRLALQVVEALLNNETYFFRDAAYFQTLANQVLPDLARKRAATRRLLIWSAGCSTGQEALSLAMLIAGQPGRWHGWTIDILGTDLSGKAIEQARSATYSQFEIQRGMPVDQMLGCFSETNDGWRAASRLREMTRFDQHNLLDPPPAPGRFDLVLCRNVLLYFDPRTRRVAFDRLASAVARDGWLMLGAGETVVGQTERFVPSPIAPGIFRPATHHASAGAAHRLPARHRHSA